MFFSKRTGSILSTALLLLFMGFIEEKHAFTIFPNDTGKPKAHEPRRSVLDIAVLGRQKGSHWVRHGIQITDITRNIPIGKAKCDKANRTTTGKSFWIG